MVTTIATNTTKQGTVIKFKNQIVFYSIYCEKATIYN